MSYNRNCPITSFKFQFPHNKILYLLQNLFIIMGKKQPQNLCYYERDHLQQQSLLNVLSVQTQNPRSGTEDCELRDCLHPREESLEQLQSCGNPPKHLFAKRLTCTA
eukprot:TRINITY_DN545_c1_g1_i6.p2 TRINITY_DN545_c1_g1~~TRINITY_DN545_c1_g1_i6.p2  ORF type:complete len:107 (+),score=4.26 TRINITY_DN545_c1_g1_i6:614-934(+)